MNDYLFVNDLEIKQDDALFPQETEYSLLKEERCIKQELNVFSEKLIELKKLISEKNHQLVEIQEKLQQFREPCPEIILGKPKYSKESSIGEKTEFLYSLFHGRRDVYAIRRWNNEKRKTTYFPYCINAWTGLCPLKQQRDKGLKGKKTECAQCKNKRYEGLNPDLIAIRQLRNPDEHGNNAIGIYPMLPGNSCYFVAIDFDEATWQSDALTVASIARNNGFQMSIERSFSGNGAHLWLFFSEEVSASKARRLVFSFLDKACQKSKTVTLRSYDRVFPTQDAIDDNGLGNLILMPLVNGAARRTEPKGTVFVDNNFETYSDQIAFLSSLPQYTNKDIDLYLRTAVTDDYSFFSPIESDSVDVLWNRKLPKLTASDCAEKSLPVFLSAGISIPKNSMTPRLLDALRRMTSFSNPEYYKSVKRNKGFVGGSINSFFQTSVESDSVIQMPRAFYNELLQFLDRCGIQYEIHDLRTKDTGLIASFNGELKAEQKPAIEALLANEAGIVKAATSFGKTVVSANLIAERKERTLILVQSTVLVNQWKKSLESFITVENLPEKRDGKRINKTGIGVYSGSKDSVSGLVDIATFQAISSRMPDFIRNYGMVIVDECHHVAADSFVRVLQSVCPKYVYGLSATVKRDDGLEKVVFAHCGKVVFEYLASEQAYDRGIAQTIVPRFTSCTISNQVGRTFNHVDATKELCTDELRNALIVTDAVRLVEIGRRILILSSLIEHTVLLQKAFIEKGIDSVVINGSMSNSEKVKAKEEIEDKTCSVIISTGKYLGEGTDIPYLDTLMVATPVSWEGIVCQYAGRIAREYEGKRQTLIYDYVDVCIPQYAKMYIKRLNTYRKLGYNVSQEYSSVDCCEVSEPGLFQGKSFYSQFDILEPIINSIRCAKTRIIVSSPEIYISKATKVIIDEMRKAVARGIKIEIRTKAIEDSINKDVQSESLSYLEGLSLSVISSQQSFLRFAVIDSSEVWFGDINLLGGAIKKYVSDEIEQKVMIHIFSSNAVDSLVDSRIGLF